MTRNDWISLGASVGSHLALLLLFALLTAGGPTPPMLGAVQVEIGAFSKGRPVQEAEPAPRDATSQPPEPSPPEAAQDAPPENRPREEDAPSEESAAPAQESTPVSLPEQEDPAQGEEPPPEEPPTKPQEEAPPARETSESPEAVGRASDSDGASEETSPAEQTAAARASAQRAASQEADEAEQQSGAEAGEAAGAATGEEGSSEDEEKASPFDIEGLDRTRLYGTMPQYTEKVNTTIRVEIIVSPQGQVVGQRLLRKGNPSLERSVMEALRQWRFNRLPSGAPQRNQTGIVTFHFRLE